MSVRDTEQDPDARIAGEAVDRLLRGGPGLTLVGTQQRLDRIIPRLHARCDRRTLLPVVFPADHGTPESLRAAVEEAHAGRAASGTSVLLIIPDAGLLSATLLRELDVAAHAAAEFGGLKFVLASTSPVRALLREAGLHSLHDALGVDLVVPPSVSAPQPMRPPPATNRSRQPAHLLQRIVLAGGILAAFVLVVALVLAAIRPGRPVLPVSPTPMPAPTAVPMPAPPAPAQPRSLPQAMPTQRAPAPPVPPGTTPAGPVQSPPSAPAGAALAPPDARPAIPPPVRSTPLVAEPVRPVPPASAPSQPAPTRLPPVPPPPPASSSLLLMAQPGDTLPVLFARVYAGSNPPPFAQVEALNPIVRPGTRLVFPPPPGGWPPKP